MMRTMDHTVIIETTSTSIAFKKYGLHLNMTRKERMANLIGKKITTLLAEKRKLPIIIQWRENHKDVTQEEEKINMKSIIPPSSNKNESRPSRRQTGHR
jgi:hypothetical protein